MQSKISLFNKTLFKKNMTRFWPFWGLASFIMAMLPFATWMYQQRSWGARYKTIDMQEALYSFLATPVPIISLLYGLVCACLVWNYLSNSKSTGMMHSLPITRKSLFFTNFLSGFAMLMIPYLVAFVLEVIVALVYHMFPFTTFMAVLAGIVAESLFFFGFATFLAFLTGNAAAMPILYFIFNFLAVSVEALVQVYVDGFCFGLTGDFEGYTKFLSPIMLIMSKVTVKHDYREVVDTDGFVLNSYLERVSINNIWILWVYALAGVLLLALAWLLYKNRKSESAGELISAPGLRPVIIYILSGLSSLIGGLFFYYIYNAFISNDNFTLVPMIICMFVGTAIGYYVTRMLFAKTVRVFNKKNFKGYLVLCVCCAVFCTAIRYDFLGIERIVPEVNDISCASFAVGGDRTMLYEGNDEELMKKVTELHSIIIDRREEILADNENADFSNDEARISVDVNYILKDGRKIKREYYIIIRQNQMSESGTLEYMLDSFVNAPEVRVRKIGIDGIYEPQYVNFRNYNNDVNDYNFYNQLNPTGFADALRKDILLNGAYKYKWFGDDGEEKYYRIDMEFVLKNYRSNPDTDSYYSANGYTEVTLSVDMPNLIQYLLDKGYITEADLEKKQDYSQDYAYGGDYIS